MPAHSTRGPGSQSRFEEALIREALYPYPDGLAIVSKVAARSDGDGASLRFDESRELRQGLEDNLAALAGRPAGGREPAGGGRGRTQ